MANDINDIPSNKHILVVGLSKKERHHFINKLISIFNLETFHAQKEIQSIDDYYNFITKNQLYKPWYNSKNYIEDQIIDFHRDWISENNSLIVLEEVDLMENDWKIELLTLYIKTSDSRKKGEKNAHLIMSQKNENGLIETLAKSFSSLKKDNRTKIQVIEQNLKVIDISTLNNTSLT